MCGTGLGSANSAEDKARNRVMNLGSSLYQSRFDAKNNFVVPVSVRDKLNRSRREFIREKRSEAYRAMGATRVEHKARSVKIEAEKVVGRLSYSGKMKSLSDSQATELERMGVGPLLPGSRAESPTEAPVIQPLVSALVYGDGKQRKNQRQNDIDRKNGKTPAWKNRSLRLYYVASIYAERAWTLHVLKQTGFTSRASRSPAYSLGRDNPGVMEGLRAVLGLPKAVAGIPPGNTYKVIPPRKWDGKPDGDKYPKIYMYQGSERVVVYNIGGSGSLGGFATGVDGTTAFTQTSKMSAPSFSLPAGEPMAGGTCVFAGMAAQKSFGDEYFICRKCYATSANYGYPQAMLASEMRFRFVVSLLSRGGAQGFADVMVAAITSYARDATGGSKRESQEMGVWDGSQILLPPNRSGRRKAVNGTVIHKSALLGLPAGVHTTFDWFQHINVKQGAVCGFFRIHDSGDFTIPGAGLSKKYLEGWGLVGERLPGVQFWAPTRIWATRKSLKRIEGSERKWVENGFRQGKRLLPWPNRGSASKAGDLLLAVRQLKGRAEERVSEVVGFVKPNIDPDDALAQGGADFLVGQQSAPGEDADLVGAGGSSFTYLPNVPICKQLIDLTSRLRNFAIRPSSLYIKTPFNPAYIPSVSVPVGRPNGKPYGRGSNSLTAGSGVNVTWASRHALKTKAQAQAQGKDPTGYVPVFDNDGKQAYQCPVYSELTVKMKGGKPVIDAKTGLPTMIEAKTCQSAGCRACWIALDVPITYGSH